MKISEIFYSVQGEGSWVGYPMAFIRFQGCPFRCRWCDSEYTLDFHQGEETPLEEVMRRVEAFGVKRACITGGEPLAHLRDFKTLVLALKELGYWLEVETSGGYRLPWDSPVDCWVMDIKCPASDMEKYNKYEELPRLRPQDQLKFVVVDRADFEFSLDVLRRYRPKCQVLFSPAFGELQPDVLADWVKRDAPEARLSLQLHKYIWSPALRGV